MKRLIISYFLISAFGVALSFADSPADILAQSDARRTIPDLAFVVQATAYDGDQVSDQSTLWGVLKLGKDHNRVLMSFQAPASKHGQKFLVDGDAVYILFEHTSNPIRVSPLEVLTGQASDGDVIRTFAADYDVVAMEQGNFEGEPALHFNLTAKVGGNTSSYKTVQLWIDPNDLNLMYGEFYAASGVLLKKAYYRDYRNILGKDFPTTIDILAGDDAKKHTKMTFLKYGKKVLPETMFRRTALSVWTPEEPR
jgi:hypothetical protein